MKTRILSSIEHADAYRGYSAAMRLLGSGDGSREALKAIARISSYLYEAGHIHWIALWALPVDEFARAFDSSRSKANA